MHFDDDENWTDSDDEEDLDLTDFYAVAVHEAGHALGLYHSNVTSSVMYPYYQGTVELDADDISGMHQIYCECNLVLGLLGFIVWILIDHVDGMKTGLT